jgi:class 3 adenylate cyclase
VTSADVDKLDAALRAMDDAGLNRINPRRLAELAGLDDRRAIDLCIVGAKAGLFDFAFHLVCPGCGGVESSHGSWNGLSRETIWCAVCRMDVKVALDDQVEVTFTINRAAVETNEDPYESPFAYFRAFFSESYQRSNTQMQILNQVQRGFVFAKPGETKTLPLVVEDGKAYRAVSVEAHSAVETEGRAGAPLERIDIDVLPVGLAPKKLVVAPGAHTVTVTHKAASPIGIMFAEDRLADFARARVEDPPQMNAFLSAKNLLNQQRFRDLFKAEALDPNLRLHLRSLTLLFTDLKGSTALYDATGDVTAYAVVQEHFEVLMDAVKKHHGAVVKTMGDAVMASFSSPEDAVAAADAMLTEMGRVNARVEQLGHSTGLKVGIHEGAALAVASDDRLDYFGQTVNIAARVQALADAGELWVTDAVMKNAPARKLLEDRGYKAEPRRVALKGVGQPTDVFKMARA